MCGITDSPGVLIQVLLLRIAGIRFIPPYNIKIHIHIKITIYKHNNTGHFGVCKEHMFVLCLILSGWRKGGDKTD
jgi:hypothetical protein